MGAVQIQGGTPLESDQHDACEGHDDASRTHFIVHTLALTLIQTDTPGGCAVRFAGALGMIQAGFGS